MGTITLGVDLAKRVFSVCEMDGAGHVLRRQELKREAFSAWLCQQPAGTVVAMVAMEDLVEEVVGDIADEYDFASRESVVTDGVLELAGSLSLIDVRSDYRVQIPEGDWTTLGGYAFAKLGRLPRMGDRIPIPGGEMEVVAMDGFHYDDIVLERRDSPI